MSMDPIWIRDISSGERLAFTDATHVEGITSMIWTERYQDAGDFEFRFADVEYGMGMLPPLSLVSLRETGEVMQVTSNEIEITEDRGPELVVRGESFAHALLRNRFIIYKVDANYNKKFKMPQQYYLDQVCCVIAFDGLVAQAQYSILCKPDMAKSSSFSVDRLIVTNSVTAGPGRPAGWLAKNRWLQQGPSIDKFMNFLVRGDMGVRLLRPPWTNPVGRTVDVLTGAANRGEYSHGNPSDTDMNNRIAFDVYAGYDLSINNTAGNIPVAFSASAGHLDDTSYLTDTSDFYNLADVRSGWGNKWVYRSTWYAGAQMRPLFVDGGAPDENENLTDFYNDLDQVGEIALKQHRKREAITTTVSEAAPWKYGQHYGLGDRVTVLGDYGYVRDMIVTEFTRAWDDDGYREFPGLTMPNDL